MLKPGGRGEEEVAAWSTTSSEREHTPNPSARQLHAEEEARRLQHLELVATIRSQLAEMAKEVEDY